MNGLVPFSGQDAEGWAQRISARWHESVEAIIGTGRLLIEAKEALEHGEFLKMCRESLPFTARTAQRLMAVGRDGRLANATTMSLLPPSASALYELTRLDDESFEKHLAAGTICPEMERKDISTAVKQQVRKTREFLLGMQQLVAPQGQFGVIVEDFEWDHETWSEKGRDRAAENHYSVARDAHLAAEIVERTKNRFACAAADSILCMWSTLQHAAIAMDVLRMRGYEYKSQYAWGKDKIGLGYWSREKHEILLIGVKGKIMCPAPGTQFESLIMAPRGEHSAKPDIFMEMIEQYFPTLPKIELNSRRARPGWTVWGFDASLPPHNPETGEIIEVPKFSLRTEGAAI